MHTIQVEKGVRLVVQDTNPSGKQTILFVHGWPLSREIFEYQLDVLPRHGIRCVSYDLRGYGDSDKPFHGYSYDAMADDLLRVVQSINCKSLTLLGFSMGGAICTRYMARHKGYKVKKLVLCGAAVPAFIKTVQSPVGMTQEQVEALIAQAGSDRPAMIDAFGRLCFATNVSEPFLRWFSALCWKAAGHATIQGLESLRDERLYGDMGKILAPTLILHGKKDRVCPFPLAREMNQGIKHSVVVPFEHSSHALFADEREKFTQVLLEYLTGG